MVPRWRFFATFLRPVFSVSPVQHVSDLHLKFALKPHHVLKYGTPHVEINLQDLQVCKYKSLNLKGETVDAGGLKWDQDQDLPPPRDSGGTNFPGLM